MPEDILDDLPFCGISGEAFAIAAQQICMWPIKKISWSLSDLLPGLTEEDWRSAVEEALSMWSVVCALDFKYNPDARTANILITVARIDGPSGTLAWSEMPCYANPWSKLVQRYDAGEYHWVRSDSPGPQELDIVRVVAHEIGHAIGIPHLGRGNLMAANYSRAVRALQAQDVAEAVRRYGRRAPVPVPTPIPEPPALPPPAEEGGIMSRILNLFKLLEKLGPIIEIIADLVQSGKLAIILDVLKKLADALGTSTKAKPIMASMHEAQDISEEGFRAIMKSAAFTFKLIAAETTSTKLDDQLAALFEQAVQTDWLFDLLWSVFAGRTTELEVSQALCCVGSFDSPIPDGSA